MKLDGYEALLESSGRGEWRSVKPSRRERGRYVRYARETVKKDRRVNIRISTRDLEAIQKRTLEEGLQSAQSVIRRLHMRRSPALRPALGANAATGLSRLAAPPRKGGVELTDLLRRG